MLPYRRRSPKRTSQRSIESMLVYGKAGAFLPRDHSRYAPISARSENNAMWSAGVSMLGWVLTWVCVPAKDKADQDLHQALALRTMCLVDCARVEQPLRKVNTKMA
jgi:hypothetical protein